ncbi:glucosamine inositolphosphorylceramide transferase family protein [Belliella pelovolcani]|uniref:Glucosamine inositolphosphorylceramide transferase 1 N-terminal domain-containing protein n=1 Tax=Belliella pelovolcani TaxID=529505 RepID=A0A1N7KVS4_9BACT|nr:hypothetical protein [Belliella pelovolcani]SIS65742.1 hypothetical protein SAMN05421761_102386 [Belliella pelovolcani]
MFITVMHKKLKVGILLDGFKVPAWVWEMVDVILRDDLATIDCLIVNQRPKPSGKPSPILYRLFSKFDRSSFSVNQSPFTRKDILKVPGLNPLILPVYPIQKKYSDYFSSEDLELLRSRELDILIRFGFRILKGDILNIPKLGVWSYHHGDNQVYRGGPPCFWEVMKGWEITGSVLQILTENLDQGNVISRSWSRTDPLSVHRNAAKVYWKSLYFIPRELAWINRFGVKAWKKKLDLSQLPFDSSAIPNLSPPTNAQMTKLFLRWLYKNLARKIKELFRKEVWELWIKSIGDAKLSKINNPKGFYLADPFIVDYEEASYLFAEQYNYLEKKGFISFARIISPNDIGEFEPVIQEDFHLSYPFILNHKGDYLMWVEAAAKKGLRMYKAIDFPSSWVFVGNHLNDIAFYDPTICMKNGLYWLFANTKPHPMASSFDELSLFYCENIEKGNWHPHPCNPIVSDVRASRPAGALFEKNGFWYRPAQDSAKHYGHRIKIQKIITWNTEEYEEETAEILESNWSNDLKGTHTVNRSDKYYVLDSYRR